MDNQITIFDILPVNESKDWREMSVEEIADYIGNALGLVFEIDTRWGGSFNEYIAKPKKNISINVGIGRYVFNNNKFIGIDVDKGNNSGFSAPCDSLEEAIEHLRRYVND